jgi:hypothetical protein
MAEPPPIPTIPTEPPSFWERQFAATITEPQVIFDGTWGVLLPAFCVAVDPIVFRHGTYGGPLVKDHAVAGLAAIALAMLSLVAWFVLRRSSPLVAGLLAGLLSGGAGLALVLGIYLLPMSIMGLLVAIGIFGFAPFLTAFVFIRNSVRAYGHASRQTERPWFLATALFGFVLFCGGPLAAQGYVDREMDHANTLLESADAAEFAQGAALLKRYRLVGNLDPLVYRYDAEKDPTRRAALADLYRELTGQDVDRRLEILLD